MLFMSGLLLFQEWMVNSIRVVPLPPSNPILLYFFSVITISRFILTNKNISDKTKSFPVWASVTLLFTIILDRIKQEKLHHSENSLQFRYVWESKTKSYLSHFVPHENSGLKRRTRNLIRTWSKFVTIHTKHGLAHLRIQAVLGSTLKTCNPNHMDMHINKL